MEVIELKNTITNQPTNKKVTDTVFFLLVNAENEDSVCYLFVVLTPGTSQCLQLSSCSINKHQINEYTLEMVELSSFDISARS